MLGGINLFGIISMVAVVKAQSLPCYHPGMTGLVIPTSYKGQILVGFWHQQKYVRLNGGQGQQELQSVISMEAASKLDNGDIIRSPEPTVLISEKFNDFTHYTIDFVDTSTLVIEVHTQIYLSTVGGYQQFRFDTSVVPPKLIRRFSGNSTTYAMVTFVDTDGELVRCGERKSAIANGKSCFKFDSVAGVYNSWSQGMSYERHLLYSQFVKVGTHQCIFGSVGDSHIECIDPAKEPLQWYTTAIQTNVDRFRGSVTKDNVVYLLPYQIGGSKPFKMEKLRVQGDVLTKDQYMMVDLGEKPKNSREYVLFNSKKTIIGRDGLSRKPQTFMWDVADLGPRVDLSTNDWWYTFSMDQCTSTDTEITTGLCSCPILARPPDNCRYKIDYDSKNCPVKWDLVCDDCPDTKSDYTCENLAEFRQAVLIKHNALRRVHGSPPLRLSTAVNNYAQEWAEDLARTNTMAGRTPTLNGENRITIGSAVPITVDQKFDGQSMADHSVLAWYNQGKNYDYHNVNNNRALVSFAKIIWKSTESLGVGCGLNANKTGAFVIVNYSPGISYGYPVSDVQINVLPPQS